MSPTELELAYRATQRRPKDFRFGQAQFMHLLRALPPPPPGASVAWRHTHLQEIIQEVRALDPRDPIGASFVVQIIAARHAAAHTARRSLEPAVSAHLAARMLRSADSLLRLALQTERLLKQHQRERLASDKAPVEIQFDMEALDAAWCRIHARAPVRGVDPTGLQSGACAQVAEPSRAAPPKARQPAVAPAPIARVKYTMCGQRIDLVRLATIPAAGTA